MAIDYTLEFHSKIEADYNDAYAWYESQSIGLGEKFLQQVRKKVEEICKHPQTFGSKGNSEYREAIIDKFPYLIIYKIYPIKKVIFIASIHHAKKHPRSKYR